MLGAARDGKYPSAIGFDLQAAIQFLKHPFYVASNATFYGIHWPDDLGPRSPIILRTVGWMHSRKGLNAIKVPQPAFGFRANAVLSLFHSFRRLEQGTRSSLFVLNTREFGPVRPKHMFQP